VGQKSGDDRLGISEGAHQRAEVDPILRAKYLDYCSARISEVFLSLTDEHTYQLMEEAAREADLSAGALGFQAMMQLVTRKHDPYLLGLWESDVEDTPGQQGDER